MFPLCTYQCQARGGGGGHRAGILTFSKRIIVKIGRNKWFTSHLLFKIDRSNTWCQVKIPTLWICITVKFPWVARRPPPLGLNIDRWLIVQPWGTSHPPSPQNSWSTPAGSDLIFGWMTKILPLLLIQKVIKLGVLDSQATLPFIWCQHLVDVSKI